MHNLTHGEATGLSAPSYVTQVVQPGSDWRPSDYFRMALRRWYLIPICAIVFALLAFSVSIREPKVYQSTAEVLVQSPASATSSNVSSSQYAAIANILGVTGGNDLTTQIEMMTNDEAMNQVAAYTKMNPVPMPADIRARFDIAPYRTSTEIITINAKAEHPRLAASLIRSLVHVYNLAVSQQSSTAIGRLTTSTQAELASVGDKLNKAEAERTAYSRSIGSVDIEAESAQKVNQLYTLRDELLTAQSNLEVAKAQYAYYDSQMKILDPSILPNLSFNANPRIEADKSQLEQLEQQRVLLSAQYTPSDDQMINNQKQIDTIKAQMADERQQESKNFALALGGSGGHVSAPPGSYEVGGGTEVLNPLRENARAKLSDEQAAIDASESQQKILKSALNSLRNDVDSTPDSLRKMNDMTANVEVLRTIYTDLQAQSAQLQARLPAEQSFATFLSGPIIPLKASSPKPELYTLLGAILGILAGCILSVIIDSGDVRLRDSKDAELLFGSPLLQSISWNRKLTSVPDTEEGLAPYKELAYTIGYLGVGKSIRSLLITSAVKDEGATSVASNLAVALSSEGQKVVLIDANLKKPKLHIFFGEQNTVGLTGLMRNGTQPDHAIVEITGINSLSLIPGGEATDLSGADVLKAEKFEMILERLKERADIIIVDAPGVFEGFDTSILADEVDGIIFVTRSGHTPRATVRRAFDLLQNCTAQLIGTVVTTTKD